MGTLPIRYLGLPLTTKSMTRNDYEPLIDRIRTRLLFWTSKSLSYAGRLQLIKSVITSITNFSPNNLSKAKVSWEELCSPRKEGGLGIRRLRDSSLTFALSLIWRLFVKFGLLYIAWTREYLLQKQSSYSPHGQVIDKY